MFQQVAELHVS